MKLTASPQRLTVQRRVLTTAACTAIALLACGSAFALRLNLIAASAPAAVKSADSHRTVSVPPGQMAGNVLHKVQPFYPQEAKAAKIQGAVLLHALIGKDGSIENLQVQSGPEELRTSALDAVRQWTYRPYLLNGEPTEVETTIAVTYSLGQ